MLTSDSVPPSVGEVWGVLVGQARPQPRPRPRRRTCGAAPRGGGLERQRIQIAHDAWGTARSGQGAASRACIAPFAFPPVLGWSEVVVDRPAQGRPLQPRGGPVILAMAQPQAAVPPAPLGAHPDEGPRIRPMANLRR